MREDTFDDRPAYMHTRRALQKHFCTSCHVLNTVVAVPCKHATQRISSDLIVIRQKTAFGRRKVQRCSGARAVRMDACML